VFTVRAPLADAAHQAGHLDYLQYGASIFVLGYPETTDRDLDALKAAGLTWARITVPWRSIEDSCNDCYRWDTLDAVVSAAQARGIKLIARIDHPPAWARTVPAENGPPDDPEDFADIVSAMVARYGSGGIAAIQVWNEPNLTREWGNAYIDAYQAYQYVHMLKRANEEAKEKDPNVTIISAGLSPTGNADGTAQPDDVYLQWMYDAGLARSADAIGMHGNASGLPPEAELMSEPVRRNHPSFYFRRVEQLHDIMVANGDAKQVWLLEFGYTSDQVNPDYSWFAIDEDTKAKYIVDAMKYAHGHLPWIAQMTVWTFADPAWDSSREQYWWAITEPDGTPRPAYNAIQAARSNGTLP
jgi:hypothetical protein